MASGDLLAVLTPHSNEPPSASFATLDTRAGYLVLDFDDTADESAIFRFAVPNNYSGGGFTVKVLWMATSATSGTSGRASTASPPTSTRCLRGTSGG